MSQTLDSEEKIKVKILDKQSKFCKLFTNTHRLQILNVLMEEIPNSLIEELQIPKKIRKELTVSQILEAIKKEFGTDLSQTALSQHLSILRTNGAVITRRDGNNIYYMIANPKLMITCSVVREIVMDVLRNEQVLLTEK